ncbi:hypothetical protein V2J09_015723 [Rumex salicifolius]
MGVKGKAKRVLSLSGRLINQAISLVVFTLLDLIDLFLCFVFKLIDFVVESEWRQCYCSSSPTGGANILVSENGETAKIMRLTASSKLHLEDVSDTLFTRPSLVSNASRLAVNGIIQLKLTRTTPFCSETVRSGFSVNSTIVEMFHAGKNIGGLRGGVTRWSDCECHTCTCWIHSSPNNNSRLFVRVDGAKDGGNEREDVLFIHGFISSSKFWTETVFPNLSTSAKSKFRLFAVDLLGFGRSPKPVDSLYTLREHVEMIEKSVIEPYKVENLHIVAHSLGCILALALAVKHPGSIKSLTLLAPPYFGSPDKGEEATQYTMRRVAPRLVWPPIAFGASIVCWYEHISRTICLIFCKHHRLWEFLLLVLSRNRIKQFLLEGFWCHTHNASWHTLHNIICGTAKKVERYLETVRESLNCEVTVFHGQDDEVIPVECSENVKAKIPRARVNVVKGEDHISIVVGREMAFARELEDIWRRSSTTT